MSDTCEEDAENLIEGIFSEGLYEGATERAVVLVHPGSYLMRTKTYLKTSE